MQCTPQQHLNHHDHHHHHPKTVLVVDDDDAIREVLTMVLESEGYRVVTAKDGVDGLHRLETETPSLVLLDNMMPVMDGREFKRVMDRSPQYRDIPVFSFSADVRSNYPETHMAGYIPKPFQVDDLLRMIGPYLQ